MNTIENTKLATVIKILVIVFAINLLFSRVSQMMQIFSIGDQFSLGTALSMSFKLPSFWTGLLVPICYLGALWSAANCLRNFEQATEFTPELFSSLIGVGEKLVYGAIASIVIVPSIEGWIALNSHRIKLHWNIEAVALGMVGVIIKLIVRRALILNSAATKH